MERLVKALQLVKAELHRCRPEVRAFKTVRRKMGTTGRRGSRRPLRDDSKATNPHAAAASIAAQALTEGGESREAGGYV